MASKNQLKDFVEKSKKVTLTKSNGACVDKFGLTASSTAGKHGPLLLEDFTLLDHLAHFDHERIPERVVHAKGSGGFGYFEVTDTEITKYCKAELFSQVGKRTPIAMRFSTVGGESGSADTVRDPRGFAVKFYTEEGNWDLVGNNTPIFFIRDPILFPSFIHTQKRNPVTHLKDPNMFWDFISLRPETTHQVAFLFSDRGIPDGFRKMNGYGSHTFKNVNADGDITYVKYHMKTDQGVQNLSVDKAAELASSNPDYSMQDLYDAIGRNDFPSWTLYIQVMSKEDSKNCSFDPFDVTKVWSHKKYPLIEVGRLALNRNPENYFAEMEQLAFSPANMIPGIEASPDKMLQGRLFSYSDTQRHRLGPNYQQLPINAPIRCPMQVYQRDGPMACGDNMKASPNYFPNSFGGPVELLTEGSKYAIEGEAGKYSTKDDDNFTQCGSFYRDVLSDNEKERLADNLAKALSAAEEFIQDRTVKNFEQVDANLGHQLRSKLVEYGKPKDESESMSNKAEPKLNPPRKRFQPEAAPGDLHATL